MKKHNKLIPSILALSCAFSAIQIPAANASDDVDTGYQTGKKLRPFSDRFEPADNQSSTPADDYSSLVEERLQEVLSFYEDLGWYNYDGQGYKGRIPSVYYAKPRFKTDLRAMPFYINVGEGDGYLMKNMASDIDALAHEFTHMVTGSKLEWCATDNLETTCLMEAYSDIMGELCDKTPDWKIATDIFVRQDRPYSLRDIADPDATLNPDSNYNIKENTFFTDYDEFLSALKDPNYTPSNADGAMIISHAAYLMSENGISRDDLTKIWFDSMEKMKDITKETRFASFSDCRRAVTAAVSAVEEYKREQYLDIINNAFDAAHVYIKGDANNDGIVDTKDIAVIESYLSGNYSALGNDRSFRSADADNDSAITQNDIESVKRDLTVYASQKYLGSNKAMKNFKKAESVKFTDGSHWCTYLTSVMDSDGTTKECIKDLKNCDRFLDSRTYGNYVTLNTTFFEGYDSSFRYEKEEPYYDCAGFAKKLQYEYFGTTKYLQLKNSNNYIPRIGDHLRLSFLGKFPHSIFITGIDGDTFTYADCNNDGNNTITWNNTGKIKGSRFELANGRTYNFEWVERPLMVGDVNGDSYVNSSDVSALRDLANNSFDDGSIAAHYKFLAADIDQNGVIDSCDIALLSNEVFSRTGITLGYLK